VKLEGIRVIDLSTFLPGPFLTQALADHGAEVIKVEAPQGDPGRQLGVSDGAQSVFFRSVNRGKKSVALNLKLDADREALLKLCDAADVFVEGFRPGVMDRLGLGYATVSARNPRIVYCSLSAFGQDGPYRQRPAHDLAVEALSGLLSMTVDGNGQPVIPGLPAADVLTGLNGLAGVLMALLRRTQTGRGDYLDISMQESLVTAMPNILGSALAFDRQPVPRHERTTGGSAFYRIYATKDGGHLVLGGQEPNFVRALLAALGRPEFQLLSDQGPGAHQQPLIDFLQETFLQKSRAEWDVFLKELDICYGVVNSLPEALGDAQLAARGTVMTDSVGRRYLNSPIRFRNEPSQPTLEAPLFGAHNQSLLGKSNAGAA
jgi:crotonobetainyl-CoA:carnitine CoA-transferase CaiB-like acyl-CoA transferase